MKLSNPNEDRVVIVVKMATRDKATGKFTYKTEKSIDVFEASPVDVVGVIEKALFAATGEKLPVTPPSATSNTATKTPVPATKK